METIHDIWKMALDMMEQHFSNITVDTWFGDARPVSIEGEVLTITTPNEMKKHYIDTKYRPTMEQILREIFSFDVTLKVLTQEELDALKRAETMENEGEYEHTFDNFVVGNSNKFAHAAAVAVSRKPGTAYNPLFIYGPSGLGKTHLLNAIAGALKATHPEYKVTYVTGENFTNEIIDAIAKKTTQEFRNKYRKSDLLLVDDVQFIAGKESTQEEFFHTFNALSGDYKQIVLTSDRTPKEISTLEERLKTRFEAGLLADISPPDYETRSAIVLAKAKKLGIDLDPLIIDFIANKITSNIRQLEGVAKKMKAMHELLDLPLNIETAQRAIEDIFKENPGLNPTSEYIIAEVSRFYDIPVEDIVGSKRGQNIMVARQIAIYLVRTMTKLSFPEIGQKFGGKDHTTILHSYNKIEEQYKTSDLIRGAVDQLTKTIRNQ